MAVTEFDKKMKGVLLFAPVISQAEAERTAREEEIKQLKEQVEELEKRPVLTPEQGIYNKKDVEFINKR
jgi:hypothetical protein